MQTFLYARTSDAEQTISHQRTQAEAAGFTFDEVVIDEGVSGVSTRFADRSGGAQLLGKLRRGDVLVVRWVDRLGRNYEDVTDTVRLLMRKGVVVRTIINAMTFDGAAKDAMTAAVRDALIGFMAATAQAQAEATKIAQRAGIDAARLADHAARDAGEPIKYRGRRPTFDAEKLQQTHELLSMGWSPSAIAKEVGIPRATVYRIEADPAKAAALLHAWGIG